MEQLREPIAELFVNDLVFSPASCDEQQTGPEADAERGNGGELRCIDVEF